MLVDRAGREGITIGVVSAEVDQVEDALGRATRTAGWDAVDLILVDYELGADARDLGRAERWAACAAAIPAPLVANTRPEVLGFDDLEQLARTQRHVRSVEDARAVAFRTLTGKDAARWLALAMNGVFLRGAYTTESARLGGVTFEEGSPLVGGAAWIVGAAAARAFAGCGWACALTEPAYRTVSDLSVAAADDRGTPIALATQSLVPSDVAREAAAAGIILLSGARDRDVAILALAPVLYRGPVGPGGVRPAAEITLADQLFVARMVPIVTELAAAIPRDSSAATARDTARIALLSVLTPDAGRTPAVDAAIRGERLEVTLRPHGFHGVEIPEITLSAPLGQRARGRPYFTFPPCAACADGAAPGFFAPGSCASRASCVGVGGAGGAALATADAEGIAGSCVAAFTVAMTRIAITPITASVPSRTTATIARIAKVVFFASGLFDEISDATCSIRGSPGESSLARAIAPFASSCRPSARSARARDRG